MLDIDEIIQTVNRSKLTTIFVEGEDDVEIYRLIENEINSLQVDFYICNGREKLFNLYDRRNEIKVKHLFVADKDHYVFGNIPTQYSDIIFTNGYSIENDLLGNPQKIISLFPEDIIKLYHKQLDLICKWFSHIINELKNGIHHKHKYTSYQLIPNKGNSLCPTISKESNFVQECDPIYKSLKSNPYQYLRGKTLLSHFTKMFSFPETPKFPKETLIVYFSKLEKSSDYESLIQRITSSI